MVSTAVLPLSSFPLLFAIPDFLHGIGRRFWQQKEPHILIFFGSIISDFLDV